MKKALIVIAGGVLLVLAILVTVTGYTLGTESGLQQLLSVAQKQAPGELSWQRVEGRLSDELDIAGLRYAQPDGLSVAIESASFEWQPQQLVGKRLRIDRLQLRGVEVHLPQPVESPTPEVSDAAFELPDLKLPLTFDFHDLDLQDIRIYPHGAEEPIHIESVKLAAAGEGETVQLVELLVRAPEGEISLNGQINPSAAYVMDLATEWRYQHADYGEFVGAGSVKGELKNQLRFEHNIEGAANLQVAATLESLLEAPAWDAELSADSDDLGPFAVPLDRAPLKASLRSNGRLEAFTVNSAIQTNTADTGAIEVVLDASGSTKQLTLNDATFNLPEQGGQLKLSGDIERETLAMDLQGEWTALGWPLTGEPDYALEQGHIKLKGTPEAFVSSLETELTGQLMGRQTLTIDASREALQLKLKSLQLVSEDRQQQLDLVGLVSLEQQQFDIQGSWTGLSWPMTGTAEYQSPQGELSAKGAFNDYRFTLDASSAGLAVPPGQWRLTGKGSDQALHQFDIRGTTLGGEILGQGDLSWKPELSWNTALSVQKINPGSHWSDLPGQIHAQLKSQGGVVNDALEMSAVIEQLGGELRGHKLGGGGGFQVSGQSLSINDLALRYGQAKISATGTLADRWDLRWDAKIPSLAEILPDATGSINAQGALIGNPKTPGGELSLDIKSLGVNEIAVASLSGSGVIDLSGDEPSKVELKGEKIALPGQQWDRLVVDGAGVPGQHDLNVRLTGELADVTLTTNGSYSEQGWQGTITDLSAQKTDFGSWVLDQPVAVKLAATRASLAELCLQSEPTRLCVLGDWSEAAGTNADVTIAGLKSERFKAYLPEGLSLDSALEGKASAQVSATGSVTATANLRIEPGTLVWRGDAEPVSVALGESLINAALAKDKLDSRLDLDLGSIGQLDANTVIIGLNEKQKLAGEVDAKLVDLSLISAFLPQLQQVAGRLNADLQLGGSVAQPLFQGELALNDFSAEVPEFATHIEETEINVRSDGKGPLLVQGRSRSGEGELKLTGSVDPTTQMLELELDGERYQVANSRTLKAQISPQMAIKMDDEGLSVDGDILIPMAYINAKGASGDEVVTGSPDIVIIAENGETAEETAASQVSVNLRVILGDDIVVEAADFSGGLAGSLLVEQTPELAPRGTGTIEVVKGDYVVYGQKLVIQRGKILFSGGPVDNPRLDLEVARRVEAYDVLAGARIGGTAQAPLLQLYSEPAMPDASILSYMLLGQPPGTKGGSFTLGKYITPDLYVSYGIGLFDAINTFNLRYKLTEKLAVHGASGLASSADLIYTFER